MSGVRRVKPELLAMRLSRFLFWRCPRESNDGDEGVIGLDAGRGFKAQFLGDNFAQGDIREAHCGWDCDQRPMAADQLPHTLSHDIYESLFIRDDEGGAS